ncbi:MAG: sulfur carrier protein ThiS adenylyltransferase ThiF [Bacteroidales bacterium]|nr:sulfur carrier protein ThiS adenylyltransferase ThiF [Bacteroidales bacterium]
MTFAEISAALSRFTVGIAGAGGLGSNCAAALARSGIGRLKIADFDLVSEANLNRQFFFHDQTGMKKVVALRENIERTGSGTSVEIFETVISPENVERIFGDCDIIVEAFDRADMKLMLTETVLTLWPGRPLILGSGLAGYGHTNEMRVRDMGDNLWVCGDESSEVSENNPPLAPRVGIAAYMQANLVIEILLKGIKE